MWHHCTIHIDIVIAVAPYSKMLDEQCWAFAQSHLKLNQKIWKVYYVHVPDVLHCCKKKKGETWSLSPLGSVCKQPFWWILMDYQYVDVNSLLNTMIKVRSSESAPLLRYFHVQYEHYSYTCITYMYESTNSYCWASLNWESLCWTGVKENKETHRSQRPWTQIHDCRSCHESAW